MIGNFQELVESIADELDRSDLSAKIPEWVYLAETALGRFIDLVEGEQMIESALVVDQEYIDMPAGFKKLIHIELQDSPLRVLNIVSPDKRSDVLHNDLSGRARTATFIGRKLYLAPVPKTAEAYKLFYYGQPPRLGPDNDTSELLEMGADVLKYAALIYSAPYLGADERILTWKAIHDEGRLTLKREYWDSHAGGGILVIRPDFAPGDTHDQAAVQE